MSEIKFFENFNVDKNKSIGITSIFSTISSKIYSHKGAWSRIIKNQLLYLGYNDVKILEKQDDFNDFDILIIDHGMEYKGDGNYNLFSGLSDELINNLINFSNYGGEVFSLEHNLIDFTEIIKSRIDNESTSNNVKLLNLDLLKNRCLKFNKVNYILKSNNYLLGDSHSLSVYEHGDFIDRNDGLTLHGALKKGIKNILKYDDFKKLKIYFGNIDIRHHLNRQDNPKESLLKLLLEYEKQLLYLNKDIEICEVLPIENISRKIPKSGYYKGEPYFGTWEQRNNLYKLFNEELKNICTRNNWNLYKHPNIYKNDKGELSFEVMEKPQSVHISREFYRWNLDDNKLNDFSKKLTNNIISYF